MFYFIISIACVVTISPEKLAVSDAPLAMIYEQQTGQSPIFIVLISLLSVINGALIQLVMASRILYGMSHQGWIPSILGHVNAVTQTPIIATSIIASIILVLVLWLPLLSLAKLTSMITLIVFGLISMIFTEFLSPVRIVGLEDNFGANGGLIVGLGIGLALESKYVNFKTSPKHVEKWRVAVRAIIGLILVFTSMIVLSPILPSDVYWLRSIRYALVTIFVIFLWPLFFDKLGL